MPTDQEQEIIEALISLGLVETQDLRRQEYPIIERGFTLRTDLFEATTPGPHFINDRCFGEDFAIWLSERLQKIHGLTRQLAVFRLPRRALTRPAVFRQQ